MPIFIKGFIMPEKTLITEVRKYFEELADKTFPSSLKSRASLVLSGSVGWGIEEGADEEADWDLHILLDDPNYRKYLDIFGPNHVIDDHTHQPIVFGQIRSLGWLTERLDGKKPGSWPLYLWIYTRGHFIQDPINIQGMINRYSLKFKSELDTLRRDHFVKFSVRRLDTSSCAKRGIITAVGINRGEMVQLALQTFSLIHEEPYPYSKWLAKHVEQVDESGHDFVQLCDRCLLATDLEIVSKCAKDLRDKLEEEMIKKVGEQRWIKFWWEFNTN
jgi:hypothetical protein